MELRKKRAEVKSQDGVNFIKNSERQTVLVADGGEWER